MSHRATNWAILQRGLKPATKMVLWHLCDRHNPDQGCFPSQELLAHDCEMSRSSLNEHLKTLQKLKLINRVASTNPATKKQLPTRYYFAFEEDQNAPEAESGIRTRETSKAESGKDEKPSPENSKSRVQNPDTNPVREPVREPFGAEQREKEEIDVEKDEKKKARAIEIAFKEFAPTWPTWVHDSEPAARKAWVGLSDDEREQAVARCGDYLQASKTGGRTQTCALAKYLNERKWLKLAEPKPDIDHPMILKPFGKGWMAHRMALLAGKRAMWQPTAYQQRMIDAGKQHLLTKDRYRAEYPLVARMDDEAEQGRNIHLRPGTTLPNTSGYVAHQKGSPQWQAWADWFEAMDYPFIAPSGEGRFAWFPADIPQAATTGATQHEDRRANG